LEGVDWILARHDDKGWGFLNVVGRVHSGHAKSGELLEGIRNRQSVREDRCIIS